MHLHVHRTASLSFFGVQGASSAFYARDMNPAEHEQALHVGSAKRIPAMPIVASHHADEIAPGIHNQMCIFLPHVAISDVSRLPTCQGHSSMFCTLIFVVAASSRNNGGGGGSKRRWWWWSRRWLLMLMHARARPCSLGLLQVCCGL